MAKIKFREPKLSKLNMQRLQLVNSIIEEYQEQGYTLTLRQLYYQLVSRDIIENKLKEYQKLSVILKEGRMGGLTDWDAIEDRLRKPYTPFNVESPAAAVDTVTKAYALDRQEGQENFMEVWVEKDALSGVLRRVTSKYHVPIMVNRGYSSVTAMFASYNRFNAALLNDQKIVLIYLGDFDPSGLDMIRDIKERILEFFLASPSTRKYFETLIDNLPEMESIYMEKVSEYAEVNWETVEIKDDHQMFDIMYMLWLGDQIEVKPVALTKAQIDKYTPPPNPAKVTDPRAKDYIAQHGDTSWEVDALKPEVLNQLLEDSITMHMDIEKYKSILEQEKLDIKELKKIVEQLKK